ncbi:MAG: hypothetical protein DMG31_13310 [Acidobacteria bacterium]|nr:MAG: hypothetical protein DMG31_13310 [Acidobacteriota bacterium]
MGQKRHDNFVNREKLILLVTFRGRGLLALDNFFLRRKLALPATLRRPTTPFPRGEPQMLG